MVESVSAVLTPWSNFYILTGSAAGALTGLMFVVITLVFGAERETRNSDGFATFSTPTVVHFCAALFAAMMLNVPWHSLLYPAGVLGLLGLCGIAYAVHLMSRTKRLTAYNPDLEDWTWYTVLPFVAYGAILAGALLLLRIPVEAMFPLAGGVVVLIFIGIRNAWDVVTYIAIGNSDISG